MAYYISEECDNCFACLDVCATNAILRPGEGYGNDEEDIEPLNYFTAYIVPERCNHCADTGAAKCVEVCGTKAIYPGNN